MSSYLDDPPQYRGVYSFGEKGLRSCSPFAHKNQSGVTITRYASERIP